jgi:hypothetical protein
LNLVFLVPMSYLYAISGTTQGLNVVTELIVGYALPGRPEALMFVKAYGYNINGQADNYTSDRSSFAVLRQENKKMIITALSCGARPQSRIRMIDCTLLTKNLCN